MGTPHLVSERDWQAGIKYISDKFGLTETAARAARDNAGWGFKCGTYDGMAVFEAPPDMEKQFRMFRDRVAEYAVCGPVQLSERLGKYIFVAL